VALAALTNRLCLSHRLHTRAGPLCLNQGKISYVYSGVVVFQLPLLFQTFQHLNILLVFVRKLLPTQQIFLLTLHIDTQLFSITFIADLELTSEQ